MQKIMISNTQYEFCGENLRRIINTSKQTNKRNGTNVRLARPKKMMNYDFYYDPFQQRGLCNILGAHQTPDDEKAHSRKRATNPESRKGADCVGEDAILTTKLHQLKIKTLSHHIYTMFQRPESTRQQLGGTHLNSAYFTSASGNGGASETYTQQQQSSPSYSYSASAPSPYYGGDSSNTYSYNDDTASKARNSMKSKTSSGGTSSMIILLLIWTVVVTGTTFGFMYYSILPAQIKAAEERLGEELEGQAVYKQKFHEMQEHSRKLEIQRDEETSLAQTLDAELVKERQWALEWKNKAIQLEQDVDALQKRIQQSAKKELIRK